mmetsp:Transcript_24117/g.40429  ORF Transcript_24117/g.40429 Transcript_24117/m.40429 type:complete len:91 (+) Transcript_24117:601-873(+)
MMDEKDGKWHHTGEGGLLSPVLFRHRLITTLTAAVTSTYAFTPTTTSTIALGHTRTIRIHCSRPIAVSCTPSAASPTPTAPSPRTPHGIP